MNTRPSKNQPRRLALAIAAASTACACLPEAPIEEIWTTVSIPPSFENLQALDARRVEACFSKEVSVDSIYSEPDLGEALTENEDEESILIVFSSPLEAGVRYTIGMEATDRHGNSLSVVSSVCGRNERIPDLLITELRTEYSKPRAEFLEIKALCDGNLGGVAIHNTSSGINTPLFTFPPCEVQSGEYIVVHLRSMEAGWIQEIGALDESPGRDACDTARDFWVEGTTKLTRKNDFMAIVDQDGDIVDALLVCDYVGEEWKQQDLEEGAHWLGANGAWKAEGGAIVPEDAAPSSGATLTRTINRDESREDSDSASDWYVCDTSGTSPGLPNNDSRYNP